LFFVSNQLTDLILKWKEKKKKKERKKKKRDGYTVF
jgi:hypothetical protein